MTAVRHRLRLWASVLFAFQAISLSAWLPWPCCSQHGHARATRTAPCHQAAAVAHCAIAPAGAAPCPMHGGQPATSEPADDATSGCSMRGVCDGPASVLAALLSIQGVMPRAIPFAIVLPAHAPPLLTRPRPINQLVPPDSPPPRA